MASETLKHMVSGLIPGNRDVSEQHVKYKRYRDAKNVNFTDEYWKAVASRNQIPMQTEKAGPRRRLAEET